MKNSATPKAEAFSTVPLMPPRWAASTSAASPSRTRPRQPRIRSLRSRSIASGRTPETRATAIGPSAPSKPSRASPRNTACSPPLMDWPQFSMRAMRCKWLLPAARMTRRRNASKMPPPAFSVSAKPSFALLPSVSQPIRSPPRCRILCRISAPPRPRRSFVSRPPASRQPGIPKSSPPCCRKPRQARLQVNRRKPPVVLRATLFPAKEKGHGTTPPCPSRRS